MKIKIALVIFLVSISFSFAENVEIKLTSAKTNMVEIQYYDENTEKFFIGYGSYVSKIENLEALKNLKEVHLVGTSFLTDLSFLANCTELEVIILYDLQVNDFGFLYSLPKLKVLDIQSVSFSKMFDLAKLINLEYVAMVSCGITNIMDFASHGQALRYINLSDNRIQDLPAIRGDEKAVFILSRNPVADEISLKSDTGNIYLERDVYTFLPDEYKRFVR